MLVTMTSQNLHYKRSGILPVIRQLLNSNPASTEPKRNMSLAADFAKVDLKTVVESLTLEEAVSLTAGANFWYTAAVSFSILQFH